MFDIGDTVKRRADIFDPNSGFKFGKVIRRYSKPIRHYNSFSLGPYPELYEVQWEDGEIENGFLPHGLQQFGA